MKGEDERGSKARGCVLSCHHHGFNSSTRAEGRRRGKGEVEE